MPRSTLVLCLLLLTGCSGINQPGQFSNSSTAQTSVCVGQGICTAALAVEQDGGDFNIIVSGTYHPIKAASIWVDGTTYPLQSLQPETGYRKTATGQRVSIHRFSSELAIREKLEQGVRVRIGADLQSYSLTRTLKRPGYTDEAWHTILAVLD
ncbi:hypothetical protein [uncultured Amphritea sp.]|uniref:hypothetical protein n=1 Tax=uncultured Amphritea sp. TaxID=981605 RepID=UPI00261957DE|nr:hypothetical protein [uncultured Amphritea sp.]